jgi:hypothetical protein
LHTERPTIPVKEEGKPVRLTYDKAGHRWKKVYKGRVWCIARGVRRTDKTAYAIALNSFQEWRQTADGDIDAHKPHADQYRQAIVQRQAMLTWLLQEVGNQEEFDAFITITNPTDGTTETISNESVGLPTYDQEHDRLVKEIDRLKLDFSKTTPPELDTIGRRQHGICIPQLADDLLRLMVLLWHRESPCPSWVVRTLIPHGSGFGEQATRN